MRQLTLSAFQVKSSPIDRLWENRTAIVLMVIGLAVTALVFAIRMGYEAGRLDEALYQADNFRTSSEQFLGALKDWLDDTRAERATES